MIPISIHMLLKMKIVGSGMRFFALLCILNKIFTLKK